MKDLAIIVPSMNEAHWLKGLLPTIQTRTDGLDIEIVVADIESTDDTAGVVAEAPFVRRVPVLNHGFAHANNVALQTVDARFVLFLNSDTEIVDGHFAALISFMNQNPDVGLIGVRQIDAAGQIYPTMRRFATPARALAEALWCERFAPSLGLRVLNHELYDRETACDWTMGSFMLVRREAIMSAGTMDERFFFTEEEQDFCLRIRRAGWDIRHVPTMTIVHHAGKRGISPRFAAQSAFAERQYAMLNFGPASRFLFVNARRLNYAIRSLSFIGGRDQAAASRAALRALGRKAAPPFVSPPSTAVPANQYDDASSGRPT